MIQQRSGDLDFLAAHDIRQTIRLVEEHARGDQDVRAEATGNANVLAGQGLDIGRTTHIGRFFPALGAADHAASDNGQSRPLRHPVTGNAGKSRLKSRHAGNGKMLDAVR